MSPTPREPLTSVVVLTHNRRDEVLSTLSRLRHNLPHTPIVAVDNGSRDDTAAAIRGRFPDITVVEAGANLGAAGRNLGVEHVDTPYVAFCDDDTCWEPGSLRAAERILQEAPDIAVLNARILVGPEGRRDPTCELMAQSPLGQTPYGPRLLGFMAGACVMRVAAFRAAGGYWPKYFIGGEEALLALDLAAAGRHIVYAQELMTRHFPSTARNAPLRRHLLARNAIWTAWLRLPARDAWRITRNTLAAVPGALARCRVILGALAGAAAVMRLRRVVPQHVAEMLRQVHENATLAHGGTFSAMDTADPSSDKHVAGPEWDASKPQR